MPERPADRRPNKSAKLVLAVSPSASIGEEVVALIEAVNVAETTVELATPDTVVMSEPHREVVGKGTFKRRITWTVSHVKPRTSAIVEITASAGRLVQKGLCRITRG